jgi:hypothetical protein
METNRPDNKPIKINANFIERRLREKHAADIFVSQCKTGGSWSSSYQILDGWAMKKSWAHPLTIGYEIKVDRQDFLNDNKWPGYLPFCNQFYFVTPSKLVIPEEIPEDVGLMWLSTTGNRFYTKKKAKHRKTEKIESLYKYILMSRTKIQAPSQYNTEESNVQYWKDWLAKKDEDKQLGYNVSQKIRMLVAERIDKIKSENYTLKSENAALQDIKEFLEKLNISTGRYFHSTSVKRQLRNLIHLIPTDVENSIIQLNRNLNSVIEIIEEAKKGLK